MKLIKNLFWFFKLEKKRYIRGIFALSLVAVLNLIPPKIMGAVIDGISVRQLSSDQLVIKLVILILSAFAMYFLRYLWRIYILGTSYRLGQIMRYRLFEQFTKMSPSFYQNYRTGDLMAHATNDINALTRLAGGGVMSAFDASVTAFVTLFMMVFTISWKMTIVAVIPLPIMAFALNRLGKKTHESFKDSQAAFSDLNNTVQESVSGIKVTKSFGYQSQELQAFQKINQRTFHKNMRTMFYDVMFDPLMLIFIGASYTLTLFIGTFLIWNKQVTIGSLVTFVTYLDMLVWPLTAIGFLFNIIQRGSVSYQRINNLLSQVSDVKESANPLPVISNGPIVYDITAFSYGTFQTLENISFSLEKGQTLGVVGQTGSGKTTLIRLLLREFDLSDGEIFLDGHNIKDYRLKDLRSLIGYVPQDQFLFASSIKDNICFGQTDLSDDKLTEVTKTSQVYDDIMAMPQKFETLVGEKGIALSGGQKQRIAIARAMILNPDILILDDSLSAVDVKTEHAIIENLKSNRQEKTTIITAHRLSAVVHADVIIVMNQGKIIEKGKHEELLSANGWYAKTYLSQQLEMEEVFDES